MPRWGIWIVTGLILLAGLAAILLLASPAERARRAAMGGLQAGDPAARVVELLGEPPVRCEAGSLEHLRPWFPDGWTSASIDVALQQLGAATRERWIYPVRGERPACAPADGQTEIGIGRDGRVLWYETITGKTRLGLPPGLTPAGPATGQATP